jgi:hypothetical protein
VFLLIHTLVLAKKFTGNTPPIAKESKEDSNAMEVELSTIEKTNSPETTKRKRASSGRDKQAASAKGKILAHGRGVQFQVKKSKT